jgi:hypothetical protein
LSGSFGRDGVGDLASRRFLFFFLFLFLFVFVRVFERRPGARALPGLDVNAPERLEQRAQLVQAPARGDVHGQYGRDEV